MNCKTEWNGKDVDATHEKHGFHRDCGFASTSMTILPQIVNLGKSQKQKGNRTMFFRDCITPGEVKSVYRNLCFMYHPDTGHGDLETMKAINVEYHKTLNSLNGHVSVGSDNKEHTYRYNYAVEQEIMDIISKVLALHMIDVEIDLIGTWVWLSGNTRPYRRQLAWNKGQGIGFKWHGKRQKWYWRRYAGRRKYSGMSFDKMKYAFGHRAFESETESAVAVA